MIIALNVVTTFMALAYCESLPYTWHICVTVDADGVITARKTISIIFGASAERSANRLPLIKTSAISGTTSIRKKETKYTLLFAKICFRFIPAKSIPVTIILAGPIIFPTAPMVLSITSGRRIRVKKSTTPTAIDIILIFSTIFFQS